MRDEMIEFNEPVKIWSMGYGSLSKEKFVSIIKENNIDFVIDVRRWPTSKLPHFKKENLRTLLQEVGVEYIWMGEKLGGFRKGGYPAYMGSPEFEEGISFIISLSKKGRACLLCLEPEPKRCHRRYIADRLSRLGFKIVDIRP